MTIASVLTRPTREQIKAAVRRQLAAGVSPEEVQYRLEQWTSPVDHWEHDPVPFRIWIEEGGYRLSGKELEERVRQTGHTGGLYPVVRDELEQITATEPGLGGPMKINELVATGAIGAAKTTVVVEALMWVLHRLLCLKSPQLHYGLDPADEIEIVFQSTNKTTAKEVGYDRLKERVFRSPWFKQFAPWDRNITSQLYFADKRVIVKPVSATGGAIGQNVIAALIDETEFQMVVKDSKRAQEVGGTWHQARENYTSMRNRIESRFRDGGLLCLVSSANRRTGFIEERAKEAGIDPRMYVYRKTHYQIAPWLYGEDTFEVFCGDDSRTPYIVTTDHKVSAADREASREIRVPDELRKAFDNDILAALRDMAGVGTDAIHPFFTNKAALVEAFGRTRPCLTRMSADLAAEHPRIVPNRFTNPLEPRFAHVDLSMSHDCCGLAVGYVSGFTKVHRGGGRTRVAGQEIEQGEWEQLPIIVLDLILQIRPPAGGEIDFASVREVLYGIAKVVPLRWVTADKFQSHDFLKIMRNKGYRVGTASMDESTWGYDVTKQAINDARLLLPYHPAAQRELIELERDLSNPKRPKVDHPATGSKDVADAIAGVVSGLSNRVEVWVRHGLKPRDVPMAIGARPKAVGKDKT